MARAGDQIKDRNLLAVSFYSPSRPGQKTASSSENMARFIRNEVFQHRDPDNTPDDEDAYEQIMADADKFDKLLKIKKHT